MYRYTSGELEAAGLERLGSAAIVVFCFKEDNVLLWAIDVTSTSLRAEAACPTFRSMSTDARFRLVMSDDTPKGIDSVSVSDPTRRISGAMMLVLLLLLLLLFVAVMATTLLLFLLFLLLLSKQYD